MSKIAALDNLTLSKRGESQALSKRGNPELSAKGRNPRLLRGNCCRN